MSGCLLGDGWACAGIAKPIIIIAWQKRILDFTMSILAAATDCESGICRRLIARKCWGLAGAPSEEQQPNVIYAMYYYGITGELRSTSIDKAKVKQKVEAAVKAAGFHIT
jgi:hypothetical protein